jgi:hypothetical protein
VQINLRLHCRRYTKRVRKIIGNMHITAEHYCTAVTLCLVEKQRECNI